MSQTKKKYVYTYDRICQNAACGKAFKTTRFAAKVCSLECSSEVIALKKRVYTPEQEALALDLLSQGKSRKEITALTGIKKPSLDKLFKNHSARLSDEHYAAAISQRWAGYSPFKAGQLRCTKCETFKSPDNFTLNSNAASGHSHTCIACSHLNYLANAEVIKARTKAYKEKNQEKAKAQDKAYYEQNREKFIERAALWALNNPEASKMHRKNEQRRNRKRKQAGVAFYRAKKAKATPQWVDREALKQIYKACPTGHHVDHIVPIHGEFVCGLHVPWNLQYLKKYQNESKGNRFVDETPLTGVCFQHQRKLDTEEEDRSNGMFFGGSIRDLVFSNEQFGAEHRNFIERYEWLGSVGYSPRYAFAARLNGKLACVLLMSEPYKYTKSPQLEALISRGASASWAPKNTGSKMVMFAVNWMIQNTTKRVFYGYSDHAAGEIGTIYQACNFKYLGCHFGAKTAYTLPSGKVVTARYFTSTLTVKQYAKDLGIAWQSEWSKPNGYKDISKIPKDIWQKICDKGSEVRLSLPFVAVAPKSKYVIVRGKDKRDQRSLDAQYALFGDSLPYPKRISQEEN